MSARSGRPDERLLLHGVTLEDADFSGRRLDDMSVANGSKLVRCDFRKAKVQGGGLGGGFEPSFYIDCVFDGAHLKRLVPGRASFVNCSFRNVKIEKMMCHEAEFVDCVFSGLLRDVTFSARPWDNERLGRTRNEYRGNDLTGARLEGVSFRGGIDLDLQRLPAGDEYLLVRDAAQVLERARAAIASWPEDELKMDANPPLSVLESDCNSGQKDIFVEKRFLGRLPETVSRLVPLLGG